MGSVDLACMSFFSRVSLELAGNGWVEQSSAITRDCIFQISVFCQFFVLHLVSNPSQDLRGVVSGELKNT